MAKRANKEGSISKRSDGRWEIKFYDMDGIRRSAYAKTQSDAREKLKSLNNEVDNGLDVTKNGIKFTDWLKTWLEVYARPSVKLSTYGSYHTYIFKHIEPTFPKVLLKDLKPDHLQLFLNEKLKSGRLDKVDGGLSKNTVRKIKVMIGTALKQAVNNGMIIKNVSEMVKLPNIDQQEMRVLTINEQVSLEKACINSTEYSAFGVYLALNTGIRLGEVLGLTWDNINLKTGVIHVCQTLNRLKAYGGKTKTIIEIGTPKTKTSRRDIPIFDSCRQKLVEYKKRQEKYITSMDGAYDDMGFVFATPLGRYLEPKTFQDLFKRQLKLAKIEDANFHSTRYPNLY